MNTKFKRGGMKLVQNSDNMPDSEIYLGEEGWCREPRAEYTSVLERGPRFHKKSSSFYPKKKTLIKK